MVLSPDFKRALEVELRRLAGRRRVEQAMTVEQAIQLAHRVRDAYDQAEQLSNQLYHYFDMVQHEMPGVKPQAQDGMAGLEAAFPEAGKSQLGRIMNALTGIRRAKQRARGRRR